MWPNSQLTLFNSFDKDFKNFDLKKKKEGIMSISKKDVVKYSELLQSSELKTRVKGNFIKLKAEKSMNLSEEDILRELAKKFDQLVVSEFMISCASSGFFTVCEDDLSEKLCVVLDELDSSRQAMLVSYRFFHQLKYILRNYRWNVYSLKLSHNGHRGFFADGVRIIRSHYVNPGEVFIYPLDRVDFIDRSATNQLSEPDYSFEIGLKTDASSIFLMRVEDALKK